MFSRKASSQPLPYLDKSDPWSSHTIIVQWLAGCSPGIKVLDVGAASGTIGRKCAEFGFVLTGIEPETEWADKARPFYRELFVSTLEDAPNDILKDHDVIICADVLEHMNDPHSALDRLVKLQEPGTKFMVSVPNFVNIWVRLNLLLGRFDYAERGILDKTHLRFFTHKRLVEMLDTSGLQLVEMKVTPIPLNLVNPFFENNRVGRGLHRMLAMLTRLLPGLLGYQFVSLSRKS